MVSGSVHAHTLTLLRAQLLYFRLYGVKVNRHGKALCPFHNDRHPSLCVADDHYYCYGCGEHGDVINFTANLFGLTLKDAAGKLIADFHLDPNKPPTAAALHDRSDGFFRRQIILTTKDKPADRADDPFLVDKLIAEREGIFLWCLEGLHRLIQNNYQFIVSNRAKENISAIVRNANNIVDFLSSEGYIVFKADYTAPTKHLYDAYKVWCDDNAEKPLSEKSFANYLGQNHDRYNLADTDKITLPGGKKCRGYEGIGVLTRYPEF